MYTRSYLHHIVRKEEVASSLLTVHNVAFQVNLLNEYDSIAAISHTSIQFQLRLMKDMRTSILEKRFPEFIKEFMIVHHQNEPIPEWIKDALAMVNVHL